MGLDEMDFPAVTICNMSPYKLSQIQAVEELEALVTHFPTLFDSLF